MSNKHYDAVVKNPVKGLRGTKKIVLLHLCHRYDTRPMVDGKPNKGYLKSYPGMIELCNVTGVSRQAVNTATESLIADGLIIRLTIGKPGRQAEFQPVYAMKLLDEHVNIGLHVSKSSKVADSDKIETVTRKPGLQIVSRKIDTISIESNKSTEPYIAERFSSILKGVPTELRSTVRAGSNIEELLNEAETLGLSRNAIREHLNVTHWRNVESAGAIVLIRLRELIAERTKQLKEAEQLAETNRQWAIEKAEREQLKSLPEVQEKFANTARELMRARSDITPLE